jgi:hypothetical protein
MIFQPTNTTALDGITGSALPGATTLNVVARNVVASLAVAALINYLQQRTMIHAADLMKHAGAAHLAPAGLSAARLLQQASAMAYQDVFTLTAVLTVPAILLAFVLRPPNYRTQRTGEQQAPAPSEVGTAAVPAAPHS